MRQKCAFTGLYGFALLLLSACAHVTGNDVTLFAGADPAALVADGRLWLYPTGDGKSLHAWRADADGRWRRAGELIRRDRIGWIEARGTRSLWAPHMAEANGRYYLYYSVGPQEPHASQIGVAVCDSPAGPCRDSGRPLIDGRDSTRMGARPVDGCSEGTPPTGSGRFRFEAIDPMLFVDPVSGRRLLYAGGSNGSVLRVFELGADMVSVLRELPVEQPPCFTEGPWMHQHEGRYYLSYSSGSWNRSNYSVRYAIAPSPLGPWTYGGTILRGDRRVQGPGHHSFFRDPATGAWKIAYHGWHRQQGDGPYRSPGRRVSIGDVIHRSDGTIAPIIVH